MKKMVIANDMLVAAVKKASVCLKDTFILSILNKDLGNGFRQASLVCCNGNAQSSAFLQVKADEDAFGQYIFGKEFGMIIQTLSSYDEANFILKQKDDGTCTISCGSAVVPLPVRESGTTIEIKDPSQAAMATLASEDFKEAVQRISKSYSVTVGGRYEVVRDAVALTTEKAGDQFELRVTASDGAMASTACVSIGAQKGMDKAVGSGLSLSVNATTFCKIAERIESKQVSVYLAEKQLLIVDGYDMYAMVPNAADFPEGVVNVLKCVPEKNYSFTVAKKKLLAAMDVALLTVKPDAKFKKFCCMVEDGILTLSSVEGDCRTKLETADISGSVRMGMNASLLKPILTHMGEDITICGEGARAVIYVNDGKAGCQSMFAPAGIDDEETREDNAAPDESGGK